MRAGEYSMQEIKAFMFARSLAGHDKGRLYVILEADEDYLYLADGRLRGAEHPKKKKRKHAQVDYHLSPLLIERAEEGSVIRDEDIRKALAEKETNA